MKPFTFCSRKRTVLNHADKSSCGNLLEDLHRVESHALPETKLRKNYLHSARTDAEVAVQKSITAFNQGRKMKERLDMSLSGSWRGLVQSHYQ